MFLKCKNKQGFNVSRTSVVVATETEKGRSVANRAG